MQSLTLLKLLNKNILIPLTPRTAPAYRSLDGGWDPESMSHTRKHGCPNESIETSLQNDRQFWRSECGVRKHPSPFGYSLHKGRLKIINLSFFVMLEGVLRPCSGQDPSTGLRMNYSTDSIFHRAILLFYTHSAGRLVRCWCTVVQTSWRLRRISGGRDCSLSVAVHEWRGQGDESEE